MRNQGVFILLIKLGALTTDMEVEMYVLIEDGKERDYIAVCGDKIIVHSPMLKSKWRNKEKFGDFNSYESSTFESYYGRSKGEILANTQRVW